VHSHAQSNWQWHDLFQIVRSRGNHEKVLKDSQGWKTSFFKNFNPPVFYNQFFGGYWKTTGFCSFFKKTQKPHSELFYCVMQYHHLQNHEIINCYSYYGVLISVEWNAPNFVFAKWCWSVNSKVAKLSKNAHSKQKSHSHTNSAVSREVYVHALLVQHL